jgi:hypothetical protein
MSKQKIHNYVFQPGVGSTSNAYPNAYTLLSANKEFIQKEATAFIAAGIISDNAINLNPNAVSRLTNNKIFLQDEIAAFIQAQVAGNISPFIGYTYNVALCKRDVGYVIDAYIYDIKYGGNEKIREVASQYWLGGAPQIDGDRTPETVAHARLRDIINNNILTGTVYASQQSPVTSVQNTSGPNGESGVATIITTESGILVNVIANGLSVLPVPSYSTRNFAEYIYDSAKCERDIGYVIDAYLHDMRYGGNIKTRFVASRYWLGDVPQIDGDRKPEIQTHQFIRDLINDYIFTTVSYLPYQQSYVIYQTGAAPAESAASARITSLSFIIVDVINIGLAHLPALEYGVSSIKIPGKVDLSTILLITNTTTGQIIYNFSDSSLGATVDVNAAFNSNGQFSDEDFPTFLQNSDYITNIILKANTVGDSPTDQLQIFVEEKELRIRPYDFGTDAIERMRVAQPQSMLDADFEYGLQPTKWQAIGIARGYPSVYEVPGTDLQVVNVVTDASTGTAGIGQSLITVTTSGPHGFTVGIPITIKALSNSISGFSRAEGTFIVAGVPNATTFTYYSISKVGTANGQVLASTYTQLRRAAFYTGSNIGSPVFTVFSNGVSGSFTTTLATPFSSDQIPFTGLVPVIGAPLTGVNIPIGAQVTGVVGTGGLVLTAVLANSVPSGATSFNVTNSTGILEGLAIDDGTGTASYVASIEGSTVNITSPILVAKQGSTQTYLNIPGTNLSSTGSGVIFTVQRVNGQYTGISVTTQGSNYFAFDQVRIQGTDLGGASPANDLIISIDGVNFLGEVLSASKVSGNSITGNAEFNNLLATGGDGTGATFNVSRTNGNYSVAITPSTVDEFGNPVHFNGNNYLETNTLTIVGTDLGGTSPANDITITVASVVDISGANPILSGVGTFTFAGTSVSSDATFTDLTSTRLDNIGAGATFNITRSAGTYSAVVNQSGTDYRIGEKINISGADLGGTSPSNDLALTVSNVSSTNIVSVTGVGSAAGAENIEFYSSITMSDVTTAIIPTSTSITVSAIAEMQVTFSSPHGLIPGAGILTSITSSGTNHTLAAGPFYVEQVPTPTTIRYTARSAGVIETAVLMAGSVFPRPDSFFLHRPYDGGVQLGTGGPQHGMQAVRQSKKYIRYQSGKGIMYTTGALFAPSYNLQNMVSTGNAVGSFITVTTDDVDHGCQVGGRIRIIGVETAGYNGAYTVIDVINERQFRIQAQTVLSNVYATLGVAAQMSVLQWHGATVRAGTFDEQNGMFLQYDGRTLAVGRRSSTFQLAGFADIARDSNQVTGTNTRFRDQLRAGDKIVIKGMTHTVTTVSSNTSLTVTPDYRGAVDGIQAKLCLVQDTIIPQSQFNLDKLDGTGESGYIVDITKMQMIGIQWSWYGAGFIDYMLRGSDGNFIFAHRIRNSNVNTEAYMRTGNLPVRYEVVNESATGTLATSITPSQTVIPLTDASNFPSESGVVYIDNEIIAFNGKSGNSLTGCTRAAPMTNFVGGSQRTFRGGAASTHEFNTGVVLISNTISPIISHWGSAIITDGRFDEDRGYIFNYAATNISVSTVKQTAFLIRLAPSVSNAIVGDLGERELLNRAQLLLQAIEITADTGTGGIVVEGVLNPQNYPLNVNAITWGGLQNSAQGGQPSFAQIAPGGSVQWSTGATQTTTPATTASFLTGTITARALSWRSNRSLENGQNFIALIESDYNAYISQGLAIGDGLSGTGVPANTTIANIQFWYTDGLLGRLWLLTMSQNANQNVAGNSTLTVSRRYALTNTSTIFFQRASWESVGATIGTEVSDTLFPAGAFVGTATLLSYFSTQYYRVTFTQTSTSTPIVAGTTTITFRFGQPPYALPGETVFSFISAPGSTSSLSLASLKELTSSTLGGRGAYPNGPDVLAINVYKSAGTAIPANIILRWGEAQA